MVESIAFLAKTGLKINGHKKFVDYFSFKIAYLINPSLRISAEDYSNSFLYSI